MKPNKTITIDGVKYVKADELPAVDNKGLQYSIVRTEKAGVFAGFVKEVIQGDGIAVAKVQNARRLWYWAGAATLSQLAIDGVSKPRECKFPAEVAEITLYGVIELIPATSAAKKSISEVSIWRA